MRVILTVVVIGVVIAAGVVLSELGQRRPSAASERLKDQVYAIPGVVSVELRGRLVLVGCRGVRGLSEPQRRELGERALRWGEAVERGRAATVYVSDERGRLAALYDRQAGWRWWADVKRDE